LREPSEDDIDESLGRDLLEAVKPGWYSQKFDKQLAYEGVTVPDVAFNISTTNQPANYYSATESTT
jgi:hypothetical protein